MIVTLLVLPGGLIQLITKYKKRKNITMKKAEEEKEGSKEEEDGVGA